uniref:Protein kinase domain-containing protein n=1 Tax=Aegilops tauschii subsp. strangulata TaxID=200361 RepID=A0A453AY96_AEGTS
WVSVMGSPRESRSPRRRRSRAWPPGPAMPPVAPPPRRRRRPPRRSRARRSSPSSPSTCRARSRRPATRARRPTRAWRPRRRAAASSGPSRRRRRPSTSARSWRGGTAPSSPTRRPSPRAASRSWASTRASASPSTSSPSTSSARRSAAATSATPAPPRPRRASTRARTSPSRSSPSLMTTAIAIEDVRREVRILSSLTGHSNLVQFYDAFEDEDNVYIVMELCKGGELLDKILARGGKYSEEDAKVVMLQILSVVSFCHLQGVVHRDLKPENFLFSSKEENSPLKVIDFGLSDFVKPDERLNDIVGSAYYVAPEVLHRSYGTEGDMWSIGVIAYILLCGSRPFWARTESGIFRAVLKAEPSFDEAPWPTLSAEAKDFVKRLLNKDYRKRMTASQALSHPWIRDAQQVKIPLDMIIYKLIRAYISSSSLRKSALRALAKTLTANQLFYLKEQFELLGPNKSGFISLQNLKSALVKNSTDAMKDSRVIDFVNTVCTLQYRKLDFEEFAASAISVYQMEALETWEQHARRAYELFDKEGNRPIVIEELASELGLGPSVPLHVVLQDWIRHADGKLSFLGFIKLLHGVSSRSIPKA